MIHLKRENNTLTATIGNQTRTATLRTDNRWVFTQGNNFSLGNGKTNFSITLAFMGDNTEKSISIADFLATAKTKTATATAGKTKTATASTTAKEIATEQKRQLEIANIIQAVKELKPICDGNTATAKQLQTLANIYAEILPEFYPDKSEQFTATANIYANKLAEKEKAEKQALENAKATTNEMLAELLEIL